MGLLEKLLIEAKRVNLDILSIVRSSSDMAIMAGLAVRKEMNVICFIQFYVKSLSNFEGVLMQGVQRRI